MPTRLTYVAIILGLIVAVAACSTQANPVYQEVAPASLSPGDPIPHPTEKVILTLYGDLATTNVGGVPYNLICLLWKSWGW